MENIIIRGKAAGARLSTVTLHLENAFSWKVIHIMTALSWYNLRFDIDISTRIVLITRYIDVYEE